MGTILASKILDDAEDLLYDATNDTWDASRLFKYLNLTQRQAAILKPDVWIVNSALQLGAGTKQSVPSTSHSIINIIRNMGTDGLTPGNVVRFIKMDTLDAIKRDWHSETASATAKHWTYDERDPKTYYVYPQNTGTGYVQAVFAGIPTDIVSNVNYTNLITLDDIYEPVLIAGVLFYAHSEDAAHSLYSAQEANKYWNMFVQGLGRKDLKEAMDMPKGMRTASIQAVQAAQTA